MLRSTMAQGLQGLTAEQLHARQTRQQQLQQHLAQQESQRLQVENLRQVAQYTHSNVHFFLLRPVSDRCETLLFLLLHKQFPYHNAPMPPR